MHILVQQANGRPCLVKVDEEDVWAGTLRYLADCGVQFDVNEEVELMTPGELSDLLAPRDE